MLIVVVTVEALNFGGLAMVISADGSRMMLTILFAIGSRDGERAIWHSGDSGVCWINLNDDKHKYKYGKRYRVLSGDL